MSRRAPGHAAPAGLIGPDEARVLATIDPERIADLTSTLVRAGGEVSVGPEHATVTELARVLRGIGADVALDDVAPGRPNLIARLGSRRRGEGIVFLGHSDVVPAGEGWSGDPSLPTGMDAMTHWRRKESRVTAVASVWVATRSR